MKKDNEERCMGAEQKRSFLQGYELSQKMLSRNSSMGYSSGVCYHRSPEGVPFVWEMQPGTPKDPPKDTVIPPLSPPPAFLSLGLPKPYIIEQHKAQTRARLGFWNKSKNNKESKNNDKAGGPRGSHGHTVDSDKFERVDESCSISSDCESSSGISSFSSSSSSSLSDDSSLQPSRLQNPGRDTFCGHLSCSPWNISAILVSIARRV